MRMVYTSTRRTGKDTDFYLINPADPTSDRLLAAQEGGGWFALDWSPDDAQILVMEYVSVNESYLWLLDAETGEKTLLTPKGGTESLLQGRTSSPRMAKAYTSSPTKTHEFARLVSLDLATGSTRR